MSDLTKRLRDGSEPLSYKRDAEAADEIARLTAREAELVAVLMTESEKCDLLSKEHYRDEIERLEAELAEYRSEWISVEDRLPDDNTCVVVYEPHVRDNDENGICIVRYLLEDNDFVDYITHWMPLSDLTKRLPAKPEQQ